VKLFARAQKTEKGFTVVELLVVAPIVILAIGAFLALIIAMTGDVIASRASNLLTYDVQDALNRIETDTKLSTGFLATNSVELEAGTHEGQGYNDALESFYNSNDPGAGDPKGDMLILNMLATTDNPTTTSSGLIYLVDTPNSCSSNNLADNTPLTYNVVYFIKNDTLWRRTIMPGDYASSTYACSTPWQQPSCAPGVSQPICTTEDIKLVEGVTTDNFIVEYFTRESDAVSNAIATDTYGTDNIDARSNALASSTTLNVVILAQQTAAGQDIEQVASIRASRLDVNASTIAPAVPDSAPSVPEVSGIFDAPNQAVYEWTRSTGGNVTYDVDYRINSGSWTSALTNTTETTYEVTADHTDLVELRVRAGNSTGDSAYDSASVTIPQWVPLVLQNAWANYGSTYSTAAYTMTKDGVVVVKGLIKRTGSPVSNETLANLPEGYRPNGTLIFGTSTDSNVGARVDVKSTGEITVNSGAAGWLSLETIRFVPDGRYTRVTPTPTPSWTNYGSGHSVASYVQTDDSRVFLQGLLSAGSWTNGTQIYDIPDALLPSAYMHVAGRSSGWGYFGIEHRTSNAEGVVAKGFGSSYLSVNTSYYPASYTGWTNITLPSNSWVWYGTVFATAQYTKSPTDNMVTLKGLIRSGTTGTAIVTLPVGFRPKERILYTSVAADAYARVDIQPNGVVSLQAGSNVWLSLDGITFLAEQ
jgi:hypothetical protein